MIGGMFKGLYWEELEDMFKGKWKKQVKRLKAFIDEHEDVQGIGGFEYQEKWESEVEKIFPDGFSFRAWGDVMSAYMNSKVGDRVYCYIDFAWTSKIKYNVRG